jgi:hypothetical protein
MRNLPTINAVHSFESKGNNVTDCIDVKDWQAQANSDDLNALYAGEVANNTSYQFHDLLFNIHYKDKTARFFRQEILTNFRELIAGVITINDIQEKATALATSIAIKEEARKSALVE